MPSTLELESLVLRLRGDSSHMQSMLRNAEQQVQQAGVHIEKTSARIEGFGFGMRRWALSAIGALGPLTGLVGSLGSAFRGVQLAAQMEQLEIAFEVLIGDADRAQQAIKDLVRFAAETPFEMPEVVGAAKQMLGFGETAENIVPTMTMLGDVASGLGLNLGELTYVFGTLRSQGRAMTQDINQFALRGIPIWATLGEVMFNDANAVQQVRQAVEQGQVSFQIVEQAFKRMTAEGGRFGGMMARQSESVLGLFSTMQDAINGALRELGKIIIETFHLKDAMRVVISAGAQVEAFFKSLSPEMKAAIAAIAGLTAAVTTLLLAWPMLRFIAVGTFIGIKVALDTLLGPINLLGLLIAAAAAIWIAEVGGMENAMRIIQKVVSDFVGWITPIWQAMTGFLAQVWVRVREGAVALWGALREGFTALGNFILEVWDSITGGARINWQAVQDAIVDALLTAEFIFKHFKDFAALTWVEIRMRLEEFGGSAEHIFKTVIPALLDFVSRNWFEAFFTMGRFTMRTLEEIARQVVTVFGSIPDLIAGNVTWEELTAGFGEAFQRIRRDFEQTLGSLPGPQIPPREIGALEQQLRREFEQGLAAFGEGLQQFVARRRAEMAQLGNDWAFAWEHNVEWTEAATQALAQNQGQAEKSQKALRDLSFVASGSAEALARIAAHNERLAQRQAQGGVPGGGVAPAAAPVPAAPPQPVQPAAMQNVGGEAIPILRQILGVSQSTFTMERDHLQEVRDQLRTLNSNLQPAGIP